MKARNYIALVSALMLAGLTAAAQGPGSMGMMGGKPQVVVTKHVDYDFHYSSRINRFHKSYATFSYYAPVYTETYWYTYNPYTWGVSIYGDDVVGVGYTGYPVYAVGYNNIYDYNYNYGFYAPVIDPYYYRVYSPVVVKVTVKSKNYYTWNPRYYAPPVYHNHYVYHQPVRYAKTPPPPKKYAPSKPKVQAPRAEYDNNHRDIPSTTSGRAQNSQRVDNQNTNRQTSQPAATRTTPQRSQTATQSTTRKASQAATRTAPQRSQTATQSTTRKAPQSAAKGTTRKASQATQSTRKASSSNTTTVKRSANKQSTTSTSSTRTTSQNR